jgi:hypothetical protein
LLAPEADHRKPAPDPAAERLRNLLAYVEQVIKLDERLALTLGEQRLLNRWSEVRVLPGSPVFSTAYE